GHTITMSHTCPECGAPWSDGQTCTDDFHQMLYWEFEHNLLDVHHLLVLCYHLQHPSLYSPETVRRGMHMLAEFVEAGVTPQAMRQQIRTAVDSGNRSGTITARPGSAGSYAHPVAWTLTARDVVRGGAANYYANVRAWAASMLAALRESGNFTG
ncbi:MAG: hypothetical protein JNJ61_23090, partial [Anaerolineae bacterium]|nr:hypothetical protein [Anaerolineae bacterium]